MKKSWLKKLLSSVVSCTILLGSFGVTLADGSTKDSSRIKEFVSASSTNGLGTAGQFAVFAKSFTNTSHMEGTIAVDNFIAASNAFGITGNCENASRNGNYYHYINHLSGNGQIILEHSYKPGTEADIVYGDSNLVEGEAFSIVFPADTVFTPYNNNLGTTISVDGHVYISVNQDEDLTGVFPTSSSRYMTVNDLPENKRIDFDSAFVSLNTLSNALASDDAVNLDGVKSGNDITYTLVDGTNIINVAYSDIYGNGTVNIVGASDNRPVIINVVDVPAGTSTISMKTNTKLRFDGQTRQAGYAVTTPILVNFPGYTGTIELGEDLRDGVILAPNATVSVATTHHGNVMANTVSNPGGEIHHGQFAGSATFTSTPVETPKGSIEVVVIDNDTMHDNVKVEGATVTINGTDYTTDEDGKIVVSDLDIGTDCTAVLTVPQGATATNNITTSPAGSLVAAEEAPSYTFYIEHAPAAPVLGSIEVVVLDKDPIHNNVPVSTTVTINGTDYTTDENGKVVVSNLEIGTNCTAVLTVPEGAVATNGIVTSPANSLVAAEEAPSYTFYIEHKGSIEITVLDNDTMHDNVPVSTTVVVDGVEYPTDQNGQVKVPNLTINTSHTVSYVVPDGATATGETSTSVVANVVPGTHTFYIEHAPAEPPMGAIIVNVIDNDTLHHNELVEGVTVIIDGDEYTTNDEGQVVVTGFEIGESYDVEIVVPTDAMPDGATSGSVFADTIPGEITFVIKHPVGTIIVYVYDEDGNKIPGATVVIEGETKTTGPDGEIILTDKPMGEYVITLVDVPEGYDMPTNPEALSSTVILTPTSTVVESTREFEIPLKSVDGDVPPTDEPPTDETPSDDTPTDGTPADETPTTTPAPSVTPTPTATPTPASVTTTVSTGEFVSIISIVGVLFMLLAIAIMIKVYRTFTKDL